MDTHRQMLVYAARRLLDSRADAEDAVQDTYLRAFDAFSDWRPPESAWMYAVLRNLGIDRRRRLGMEARHAEPGLAIDHSSDPALELEITTKCEAALRHLLTRVSAAEAAAILLRDVFELDYREIAAMLGRTEPTTRQFLHRARSRARSVESCAEADESCLRLCWLAIQAREPALLMEMLPGITVRAQAFPTTDGRESGARCACMLVQINGRYAIALVLDGVVLCTVPVGVKAICPGETA